MTKPFFLLALFFCFCSRAQDKYLKTEEEVKELSKKVTELFKANNTSKGISEMEPYWPIPQNEVDELKEQTVKQFNLVKMRYGDAINTVKVKEERIADFAIRETWFVRYEFTALRLTFTFYKGSKGWIVNSFKWDDSFKEEFK